MHHTQIASYPLALIRTRLQAQGVGGGANKYVGMGDVLKKTLEREGFLGLYKVRACVCVCACARSKSAVQCSDKTHASVYLCMRMCAGKSDWEHEDTLLRMLSRVTMEFHRDCVQF